MTKTEIEYAIAEYLGEHITKAKASVREFRGQPLNGQEMLGASLSGLFVGLTELLTDLVHQSNELKLLQDRVSGETVKCFQAVETQLEDLEDGVGDLREEMRQVRSTPGTQVIFQPRGVVYSQERLKAYLEERPDVVVQSCTVSLPAYTAVVGKPALDLGKAVPPPPKRPAVGVFVSGEVAKADMIAHPDTLYQPAWGDDVRYRYHAGEFQWKPCLNSEWLMGRTDFEYEDRHLSCTYARVDTSRPLPGKVKRPAVGATVDVIRARDDMKAHPLKARYLRAGGTCVYLFNGNRFVMENIFGNLVDCCGFNDEGCDLNNIQATRQADRS